MVRKLFISACFLGVGILVGVLLPVSITDTASNKLAIKFVGYEGQNDFGEMVNRLRLEFRESMVVQSIDINEGNCGLNPYDVLIDGEFFEFPISVGMGTVIDGLTDCGVFVQLSIQTDKGLFKEEFPSS